MRSQVRSPRDRARTVRAVLAILLACSAAAAARAAAADPPFRDPTLSLDARIADLLSQLTLDEKISLLHQYQPAIPRLGLPAFRTGTEALHGVAWLGQATVFPQAVGMASTWDPALIQKVGSAVGDEARGFNAQNPAFNGINLWAPVVNLLRDPRWGRNEEGYSEDPFLTGRISVAYCGGLRGDDPRYLKTAPTLKHFLAYNNEVRRDTTSSSVSPRVMWEYDRKAFQPAIAAGVATGVMPSYNLVNGRPDTVSADINDVLRTWTDKELMVVSDAYAPYNLTGSEAYYATQPEADAAAIQAGLDSFTIDDANSAPMIAAIQAAVAGGFLAEADIDQAVHHILSVRFRLGDFDPPGLNPYAAITPAVINSPEHQALARRTAAEAMVLLKNDRRALPLDAGRVKKVAVIGPLATTLYSDWYSGTMPYQITPAQGIADRLGAGAVVTATEGVDRIALRDVASGLYVTAPTDAAGGTLFASSASAGTPQAFDVFDWGEGVVTLRAAANGKVLARSWDAGKVINVDAQPNGWFVMQQFKLDPQADGTTVLEYAGYELREGWYDGKKYVVVGADGQLAVSTTSLDQASRFQLEVLRSGVQAAVAAASAADVAILVVGSMPFINGRENRDRQDIALPIGQEELAQAVRAANPRTVMVLETSYPVAINWENDHIPAILWTTHAGQETGRALADVLFGDAAPAGRLTQTWYRSLSDLPDILDYDIISSDRTYLYFRGSPLYPFGHGLTYSPFTYRNLRLSTPVTGPGGTVRVQVDVTNGGARAGDEVVQLYTRQLTSRVKQPLKALRGFERVHLAAGETRRVTFQIEAQDLAFWDVTRSRPVVEAALHEVQVGRSSADIRATARLAVLGDVIPPRDLGQATRAESYDAHGGTALVDESKVRGTAVGSTGAGDWIAFQRVDLRHGADAFTAQIAREATTPGQIQLRLDDPVTGPVIGAVPVAASGSRYAYATATAPVSGASGIRDLYLVFDGAGTRVSTFQFALHRR